MKKLSESRFVNGFSLDALSELGKSASIYKQINITDNKTIVIYYIFVLSVFIYVRILQNSYDKHLIMNVIYVIV